MNSPAARTTILIIVSVIGGAIIIPVYSESHNGHLPRYPQEIVNGLEEGAHFYPYVDIEFKSSSFLLLKGKKDKEGVCHFKNVLTVNSKDNLKEGEKKVRVRRARNYEKCIDLIEEGIVEGSVIER